MKDFVKKAEAFITFDYPVQINHIRLEFANMQRKLQAEIPEWSTNATRQKLISNYWNTYVAGHFALVLGLAASVMLFGNNPFDKGYLLSIFMAGLLSFPALYLFHYRPTFGSLFLPRLETVKEAYERKATEQVEKCRKAQLSNFALTLIFYVFDRTSKINALQCNDQSAGLLMSLYGVDSGSLKKNLELIFGKKKNLPARKVTEIQNRFEESYKFFEHLDFAEGVRALKVLETKFAS